MTETLRVRAYNVGFGDAILLSAPDRDPDGEVTIRHLLIDVGNVLAGEGGKDAVFQPVIEDILTELGEKPLDLYLMSHEHMDHIQGLYYAEKKLFPDSDFSLRDSLNPEHVWLTASAAEDYYENHPDAKERHLKLNQTYNAIQSYLNFSAAAQPTEVSTLMEINNPRSSKDCVNYIQQLSDKTHYVHREFEIKNNHPFNELKLEIWAPEEDTSEYYGPFQPMFLGIGELEDFKNEQLPAVLNPPPGVDAGAFFNLVKIRRQYFDNLLAIDKAKNNTSVVLYVEWRGWKLLFPGDAENRSWKTMAREGILKPVHFLKVSHHGSHNGTPDPEILDQIFPATPHDHRQRSALVCTYQGTYHNVPDSQTLSLIKNRCDNLLEVHKEVKIGGYVDLEFPANSDLEESNA